jgi:GTP-binding protein
VLVHLLDGAKTLDEILHDKSTIETELTAWNPRLAEKPALLALNKIDLPDAREHLVALRERFGDIRGISAATHEGVRDLVMAAWRAIGEAPLPQIVVPEAVRIELRGTQAFTIERSDAGEFVVSGERVDRLAAMTDFNSDEALARFERTLAKMGVEKRLVEMGATEGDTVRIGPYEFTYS